MTTSADVTAGLRVLGITAGDTVFFHSSLKSMGRVTGGPEAVVGGFLEGGRSDRNRRRTDIYAHRAPRSVRLLV